MYSKARLEALTDGLFAVAMTILVLDVRLPDDFHPADQTELAQALLALWPKFFPYVISFYVLGSTWLANVKLRSRGEFVDRRCAFWWLFYLFLARACRSRPLWLGASCTMAPRYGCTRSIWARFRRSVID